MYRMIGNYRQDEVSTAFKDVAEYPEEARLRSTMLRFENFCSYRFGLHLYSRLNFLRRRTPRQVDQIRRRLAVYHLLIHKHQNTLPTRRHKHFV